MLDSKYHLKIIDFGDAKLFDDSVYEYETDSRQSKAVRETGALGFAPNA
jgi:serine/threonine protein kinase